MSSGSVGSVIFDGETNEKDVASRRDDALRRALNTPPQPKPIRKKKDRERVAEEANAQKPEPLAEGS